MLNYQDNSLSSSGRAEERDAPPAPGVPVWVQCKGFRTMAYRDAKGAWRTVARNQELQGPVRVVRN